MTDKTSTRKAGRPRREGADEAILREAIALVRERGYAEVTLDAIAKRAGVAKTTLYRRWSSKAALIANALNVSLPAIAPDPDADDLLASMLTQLRELLASESGPLLASIAAESAGEPEVRALLWRVLRPDELVALAEKRSLSADQLVGELWLREVVFR